MLVIAFIVYQLKLPNIKSAPADEEVLATTEKKSIFTISNLKFGVWALFFYVGAEVAIGTFLTNYIADTLGIEENQANNYVAFYWGGMLVGRLVGSIILKSMKPSTV